MSREQEDPEFDTHHRRPKFRGGKGGRNIVKVRCVEHRAFNTLFPNSPDVHQIAKILNDTWIDERFRLVVVTRKRKANNVPVQECTM
jgi:hypothetical protein